MTNDSDISDFVTPYHEEKSSSVELFYTSDKTIIEKVRIHGKWHLIKRIAKVHEFSPQHRSSLEREFEIGFRLDHPHIVRYIDKKYSENGVPYLILEYVDGCTLRDLMLKPQSVNGFDAKKCFKTIVETLVYLHKKQIYHLDIKPENIIVTHKEQNIKLIDFGFTESDSFGQPLGSSTHYKAPEFTGDSSVIDGRTDMYSFALTMKELCETAGIALPRCYKMVIKKSLNADASKRIDSETALAMITKKPRIALWLLVLLPIIIATVLFILYPKVQRIDTTKKNDTVFVKQIEEHAITKTVKSDYPSRKDWRKSFDSAMKAAEEPKLITSVKDSARCVQLGKQLWDLYKLAKSKRTLTKREKIKISDHTFDSLYTTYLEYEKKWAKGSPEFIFYSGLWHTTVQTSQDSINRDIFGR